MCEWERVSEKERERDTVYGFNYVQTLFSRISNDHAFCGQLNSAISENLLFLLMLNFQIHMDLISGICFPTEIHEILSLAQH